MPEPANWSCTVCGGVVGPAVAPPAHCPECHALASLLVPTDEPPHGIAHNPFQPHDRERSGDTLGPGVAGCVED